MSINTLTVFHRADFDGLACEAIARRALGETSHYLGFDYGDKLPDLTHYSTVYLLDISLPVEAMRENAWKIIWIDHHKSAIEAMSDLTIKGLRVDGVAACRLAWQWFNEPTRPVRVAQKSEYVDHNVEEPYAIQLLGEYDIWCKTNPDTDLFQLGIQSEPNPPWEGLLDGVYNTSRLLVASYVEKGRVIQRYTDTINAQIATERGFDLQWEGFYWRCLNTARCNSMTFTAALRPEHDGCLAYHWNGKHWKFSLYGVPHKPTLNLSVVSKKYGGGGHAQASGFQLSMLPQELGGA